MNELKKLFLDVEEEYNDESDDWEIPDPEDPMEEIDDWAETWLDGIDDEDVEYFDPDTFWENYSN